MSLICGHYWNFENRQQAPPQNGCCHWECGQSQKMKFPTKHPCSTYAAVSQKKTISFDLQQIPRDVIYPGDIKMMPPELVWSISYNKEKEESQDWERGKPGFPILVGITGILSQTTLTALWLNRWDAAWSADSLNTQGYISEQGCGVSWDGFYSLLSQ